MGGLRHRMNRDNPYLLKDGSPRPSDYYHIFPPTTDDVVPDAEPTPAPRTCVGCGRLLLPDQVIRTELEPGQYVIEVGDDQAVKVYEPDLWPATRTVRLSKGNEVELRTKWPVRM
jgi:hypothetical protein